MLATRTYAGTTNQGWTFEAIEYPQQDLKYETSIA